MDVLDEILVARRKSVAQAKEKISLEEMQRLARQASLPVSFAPALNKPGSIAVIAEMKAKSPSAGPIREPYNVEEIAKAYEKGGASALSVLTEPERFGGNVEDLRKVRSASRLPILRKDFVFDPYQVIEARAFGADAVLLIAEMLSPAQLIELVDCAREYQIEPLVEVFSTETIPAAINSRATVIGINTRNLRTLQMSPENVWRLSELIPRDRTIVGESGIKTREDMERLKPLRVNAVLVGESFLKQKDLESAVRTLVEAGRKS